MVFRVTAFTLQTLNDADVAEWQQDLYIETSLLNKIATWITTQQDQSTGAFFEEGPIYDVRFQVSYVVMISDLGFLVTSTSCCVDMFVKCIIPFEFLDISQ